MSVVDSERCRSRRSRCGPLTLSPPYSDEDAEFYRLLTSPQAAGVSPGGAFLKRAFVHGLARRCTRWRAGSVPFRRATTRAQAGDVQGPCP